MGQYSGMWTLSQASQAVKSQTWTGLPPSVVEYLIVAGGGGGGYYENAGGGGTQDANIAFDDLTSLTLNAIDLLEIEIFGYLFNNYVEKEVLYS